MDGFENFDQQERSWSYLEEHGERLAREAAEVLAERPGEELAGLILESGAPEWKRFRTMLEQATGQELVTRVFVGIVPRPVAVQVAIANGGASAEEWLEGNAPGWMRRLPIVVITRDGLRMGAVGIPARRGE